MYKIQFDVNVANGVTIGVVNDALPVRWIAVYPFRFNQSKSLLHTEIKSFWYTPGKNEYYLDVSLARMICNMDETLIRIITDVSLVRSGYHDYFSKLLCTCLVVQKQF